MDEVLQKNILREVALRGLSLTDLSKISGVPYRTIQDLVTKSPKRRKVARITTVAAIAAGLGVTPGKLLEDSSGMHAEPRSKPTPEEALAIIAESLKALKPLSAIKWEVISLLSALDDEEVAFYRNLLRRSAERLPNDGGKDSSEHQVNAVQPAKAKR